MSGRTNIPYFQFSAQGSWTWALTFLKQDGTANSLAGRTFKAYVTNSGDVAPAIALFEGSGLTKSGASTNSLVFTLSKANVQNLLRLGVVTADIYEVSGSSEILMQPVKIEYVIPSDLRGIQIAAYNVILQSPEVILLPSGPPGPAGPAGPAGSGGTGGAAVSDAAPKKAATNGAGSPGTSNLASRDDHVHPRDVTRGQFKRAIGSGNVATIEASIPDDPGNTYAIAWRDEPFVPQGGVLATYVASKLSLSAAQMTAVFASAADQPI